MTPWTAAHHVSLSFIISQSLLRLMSTESVMLFSILSSVVPFSTCLLYFPASKCFPVNLLFPSCGQSIRASGSASVLPVNIQGWFPLGLTGLIALQSKGLSRVLSKTTVWKYQFFSVHPYLWSNSNTHIWQPGQHIKKQRHYFANKGLSSQGYGFSWGHVWMWELDCEEGWVPKNWCFWTVVLERTLESPLDCKEIQPVHPKGN